MDCWQNSMSTTTITVTTTPTVRTRKGRFTAPVIRDIQEMGSCVLVSQIQFEGSTVALCLLETV